MNTIKALRLQHAWSQEQLAEMAAVSVRTIQRIENGERPGLETLSALAAVFEVSVAELSGKRKTVMQRSTNASRMPASRCITSRASGGRC